MTKKSLLAILLIAAVGFTSCVRDEDLDLFKHPINIQGELTPNYGVPVAHGSVDIDGLLHMLSSEYTGFLDPDANVLTIVFDTTGSETINGYRGGSSSAAAYASKPMPSTKNIFFRTDTIMSYELPINLFDEVDVSEIVDNHNIEIDSLVLSLDLNLTANATADVVTLFSSSSSRAILRDFQIEYIDHDNNLKQFADDQFDSVSVSMSELLTPNGQDMNIRNLNLAPIINDLPRRIIVKYRLVLEMDDIVFRNGSIAPTSMATMLDSVKVTSLNVDYALDARFPFHISIGKLPYNFSLNMGNNTASLNIDSVVAAIDSGIYVDLREARFTLLLDNGLPLNLNIKATLLDADSLPIMRNGQPVCLIDGEIQKSNTIEIAEGSGVYHTASPRTSELSVRLDRDKLDDFSDAQYIAFSLSMGTNSQMVAVEKSDMLGIRAYIVLQPTVGLDIPVFEEGIL